MHLQHSMSCLQLQGAKAVELYPANVCKVGVIAARHQGEHCFGTVLLGHKIICQDPCSSEPTAG